MADDVKKANLTVTVANSAMTTPLPSPQVYYHILDSPHAPPDTELMLLEPYNYLNKIPGKGVRSALMDAFNVWLRIPADKMESIQQVVEMLHNASLLIDDIEDNSQMRRGVPVTHAIYGVASVINSANYVYFLCMDRVRRLGDPRCIDVFLEELLNLHRGQGLDIHWRDNNLCPTEEQYQRMVLDKTGGLFRLAVKLMQIFSENRSDFNPLVNTLSTFYQIRDDYVNLQSRDYMANKGYCEDITEGKYSFPIIHCILKNPSDHRMTKILKQKTSDRSIIDHAVEYMRSMGSFEYTDATLRKMYARLLEEVAKLGGNPILEHFITKKLGNWNKPAAGASAPSEEGGAAAEA